jgi:hypothetical protein
MTSPVKYGDTVCTDELTEHDHDQLASEWDSWVAEPQDDNECLTFKRMLPNLGPKPFEGA